MKRIETKLGVIAMLSCILTAGAFAQAAAPAPGTEAERSQRQQQRIGQGVTSGQLTARESSNLEGREASVHSEKQNMRASDNGHLTASDRRQLNRRQNHISRSISNDKHNARVR